MNLADLIKRVLIRQVAPLQLNHLRKHPVSTSILQCKSFAMKFIQVATLIGAALALPSDPLSARQTCASPKLRKGWSKATVAEKTSYINAAVCITKKPSRLGNANATLHDDFAYVHALLSSPQKSKCRHAYLVRSEPVLRTDLLVHFFAGFLPWHRYFVQVYEKALRDCGYTGNAMYWDWVADSSAPSKAAVWDPVTGFGGNGVKTNDNGPRLRVVDGPFKNFRPVYWNTGVEPHWLSRDWVPADPQNGVPEMLGSNYSPAVMAEVNAQTTFDGFRNALENGPHAAVHAGVGGGFFGLGDMGLQNASPNGESSNLEVIRSTLTFVVNRPAILPSSYPGR